MVSNFSYILIYTFFLHHVTYIEFWWIAEYIAGRKYGYIAEYIAGYIEIVFLVKLRIYREICFVKVIVFGKVVCFHYFHFFQHWKTQFGFFGDYEKIRRKIYWNLYQIDVELRIQVFLDITLITQWCETFLISSYYTIFLHQSVISVISYRRWLRKSYFWQ